MIVESHKSLYECGADVIINIIGMSGNCFPSHSIFVQCTDSSLEETRIYNTYRPTEHWGHCFMVNSRCKLRESGRVWVALLSASEYNSKRKDCVANLKHLESSLKELNDWIEQNGNDKSVCIQHRCGAGWLYEWEPIIDILNRTLPNRKVIICHGYNTDVPLPDDYGKPQPTKRNWLMELFELFFK